MKLEIESCEFHFRDPQRAVYYLQLVGEVALRIELSRKPYYRDDAHGNLTVDGQGWFARLALEGGEGYSDQSEGITRAGLEALKVNSLQDLVLTYQDQPVIISNPE